MSVDTPSSPGTPKTDRERLNELGYAQELRRVDSARSRTSPISFFDHLDPPGGHDLLLHLCGGTAAVTVSWIIIGGSHCSRAMGQICSAFPTAGGLYYWSAKLPGGTRPAKAWYTGWFNLVGQVVIAAYRLRPRRSSSSTS